MKRAKLSKAKGGGNYFARRPDSVQFVASGCTPLDSDLGGGWAEKRVANIVGDKSTGKTLLCIEAMANFAIKYKQGGIYYREAEAAFDNAYAAALGMPIDRIDFGEPLFTVETFFNDLTNVCKKHKRSKKPALYILDSLDGLSDEAEQARSIDKGSFGAAKAKKLSELFRRLIVTLKNSNVTLIIVSQVRDRIGVMFGEKHSRTGGHALDFYASQIVWLYHAKNIVRTKGKIKRVTGILIRSKVKKNKVGLPHRESTFPIKFGYGVDDEVACVNWLESIGMKEEDMPANIEELKALTRNKWIEVETSFLPKRGKYT